MYLVLFLFNKMQTHY